MPRAWQYAGGVCEVMKDIYKDKIARMRDGDRKITALLFANNEGKVITAADIESKIKSQARARDLVGALRASGWVIENSSEVGLSAKWICRGVGNRKSSPLNTPKPKLNPYIEAVFR